MPTPSDADDPPVIPGGVASTVSATVSGPFKNRFSLDEYIVTTEKVYARVEHHGDRLRIGMAPVGWNGPENFSFTSDAIEHIEVVLLAISEQLLGIPRESVLQSKLAEAYERGAEDEIWNNEHRLAISRGELSRIENPYEH